VKFATSRRMAAGATVLAVAGAAAGTAIAQANGGAAPVARAAANGGISLRPDTVQHLATKGNVGKVTVKNTTSGTLRTTVTVRPWSQNRTTGNVSENYRVNLSPYVVANVRTFNLGAGQSRVVTMKVRRTPPHGSLYAALDVFAKQLHVKKHNGIIPQYRVVGRVRLDPKRKNQALKFGTANIVGKGKGRTLILQVRNSGNTLDAVSGTANITGPMQRTVNLTPVAIVPGQVVFVRALNINGMKKGLYHVTFNVTHGTRHWRANRIFGVH
jgi:hypothetical protein